MIKSIFLTVLCLFLKVSTFSQHEVVPDNKTEISGSEHRVGNTQFCTVVVRSDGNKILTGNNEDYTYPFTSVFTFPAIEGKYGRIFFGFYFSKTNHGYCGGMNDQGLSIDGLGIENTGWKPEANKPKTSELEGFNGNLESYILEHFATVNEVITFFNTYNVPHLESGKFLVADKTGASMVVEWAKGKTQILRREGDYQIATNFVQSNFEPGHYPDFRYNLVERLFRESDDCSVEGIRRILNAAHWEDPGSATLYSYICDLKAGDIYIYNFHNYDNVAKINLQEAMKKGEKIRSISSLFPYETCAQMRFKAEKITGILYQRIVSKGVNGPEGAISLYQEYKSQSDEILRFDIDEAQLNTLGYRLVRNNRLSEALDIFTFITTEYPQSANAFDSLGEAYLSLGDEEHAIENYQKSLVLNPNNKNAEQILEKLRGK